MVLTIGKAGRGHNGKLRRLLSRKISDVRLKNAMLELIAKR